MNLQEWQANENLAEYAHGLLGDPRFQGLIGMLESSHIKNFPPSMGIEFASQTHSMMLGQIYGYDLCLNNLRAAAIFNPALEPLQSKFEPHEIQPES